MTAHQRNVSASIDPVKLDRLAEVAVKVGLRLQPGQDLLLTAPSAALPLVRRIAEHAYRAGAGVGSRNSQPAAYGADWFRRRPGWRLDRDARRHSDHLVRHARPAEE